MEYNGNINKANATSTGTGNGFNKPTSQNNGIDPNVYDGVKFLCGKEMKTLFIGLIVLLEDSLERNEIDEDLFEFLRKRILDIGNGAIRNVNEQLELYKRITNLKK